MAKLFLSVFACIFATSFGYNFTVFKNEIDQKCLARLETPTNPNGDVKLMGLTMNSFISMVEKVERNHTDWDIYTVSRVLLKRFAFDGITYEISSSVRTPKQALRYKVRWEIIKKLLGEGAYNEHFREEDLNENEKCTMYFMMGHLVNTTFREGIDGEDFYLNILNEPGSEGRTQTKSERFLKKPREQGVVNVEGMRYHAVAVNRILNAILASQISTEHNVYELFQIQDNDFPKDKRINSLMGVTMGDLLSTAGIYHTVGTSQLRYFGPGGEWTHTICPEEFRLNGNATGTTNAELRGAIDGLLISQALIDIKSRTASDRDVTLSRLLRMYYSNQGIPVSYSNSGYSYCRRSDVLSTPSGSNGIVESAQAFYLVQAYRVTSQIPDKTNDIIGEAYSHVSSAIAEMDNQDRNGDCGATIINSQDPVCETPSNVFVVLDDSEIKTEGFSEQQHIVGELARHLDIGIGAGSYSVLFDLRGYQNDLKGVYYNATNPACATCATARIEKKDYPGSSEDIVTVLDMLNKTLQRFELESDQQPGVPSKVAILFQFEDLKESDRSRLHRARDMIRYGHRDVRFLLVGGSENVEALKQIAYDGGDVYPVNSFPEQTAKTLAERICRAPAVLQYNKCWKHKDREEESNKYEGYVSTHHVQYWAMYPEYFLKSYDIEFQFTADNGAIKVCEARGVDNPAINDKKTHCKETNGNEKTLTFRYKDPCHKYHVDNCPPINFAIVGVTGTGSGSSAPKQFRCPGDDHKCRRLDQTHFTISHKGIFCSGCDFLRSSPVIMFFLAVVYFFSNSR